VDLQRAQKSDAASAVSEILFQKSCVTLEQVRQARRPSDVIVDWSCSREFQQRMSKRDSTGGQKRHMWDVAWTVGLAGVLGFWWNDCSSQLYSHSNISPLAKIGAWELLGPTRYSVLLSKVLFLN